MKRVTAIFLILALLAAGLGGCKNQDKPYKPTGDALTSDDGSVNPLAPPSQSDKNQELTLIYYPDRSMNPLECTDFTNRTLFSLIYQSLFIVDRNYKVEPMLCKQYRISEDMKTYTFYPEAATFSDGSTLTAQDVLASLLAAKESPMYKGRFLHISEIVLSDDGGVTVRMDTACENLPVLLDIPIVKAAQVAEPYPLGTGPYMLDLAGKAVLRRRGSWWCDARMTVSAPAISLKTAENEPQIRDQFEFNDLDLVCADPGSDRYTDYRCDYELWDCENGIFLFLACNMDSPVFSNEKVRSALTYSIDRDTLAASYYRGFARSACLPASPLSPYYSSVLAAKYAYDGSGETLYSAVSEASLTGSKVVLLVNSDDSLRLRVARDIGDALAKSGLTVEMKELSSNAYLKALQMREYDLYLGQTKLSANMDLSAFFSSRGALSYGGINDVSLYALCSESLANYGNYYTLHQNVMSDGRLVPILFRSYAVYATRGLLTGLTPSRDNVFYYSLNKTMEHALIRNEA